MREVEKTVHKKIVDELNRRRLQEPTAATEPTTTTQEPSTAAATEPTTTTQEPTTTAATEPTTTTQETITGDL